MNITSESPSIQTIYDWFTKGRLIVNRRYQRKLVWTLEDKKALIETIQRQYPLPNILLAAKDEKYEIIDGLQRLNAIIGFINKEFTTNDNKYFNLSEFPAAKDYLENLDEGYGADASDTTKNVDTVLDRNQVTSYLSYVLPVSIMRDATSVDIDNAFSRINRYGHKLSDQESRQAGAVTPFSNYIRKLSQRIRQDDTPDILDLSKMPEISISTPRGGLNYKIESNNTFWVKQHILNNRDLVTSEDEQYLAELVACILDGKMLKREREALDSLYDDSDRAQEINKKLQEYNPDKLTVEILRCIQIVEKTTNSSGTFESIRDLVVENKSNPIPAFFNLLMTALHRTIFTNKRHIADYRELASRLKGSYKRAQVKK